LGVLCYIFFPSRLYGLAAAAIAFVCGAHWMYDLTTLFSFFSRNSPSPFFPSARSGEFIVRKADEHGVDQVVFVYTVEGSAFGELSLM
jgi:hypothetical protein